MTNKINISNIIKDLDNEVIGLEDLNEKETKALEHKFGNQLTSMVL